MIRTTGIGGCAQGLPPCRNRCGKTSVIPGPPSRHAVLPRRPCGRDRAHAAWVRGCAFRATETDSIAADATGGGAAASTPDRDPLSGPLTRCRARARQPDPQQALRGTVAGCVLDRERPRAGLERSVLRVSPDGMSALLRKDRLEVPSPPGTQATAGQLGRPRPCHTPCGRGPRPRRVHCIVRFAGRRSRKMSQARIFARGQGRPGHRGRCHVQTSACSMVRAGHGRTAMRGAAHRPAWSAMPGKSARSSRPALAPGRALRSFQKGPRGPDD
jgi:hypothetical protein